MKIKNIEHECELFAKKMMEFNPNVMIEFNVHNTNEMAADLETPGERMEILFTKMDFDLLWHKWMTKICPMPKELIKFDSMNRQQQYNYLKEKLNENK
tara:strand:+ start:63 stop:356 length:294 start_codon:yes stop_codon:yes gene_type:complete